MKLSDFDFALPERLIAQNPAPERDLSRMMVVWRETGKREHRRFRDLPDILGPGHFLVINTSRVFPARLLACRPGKAEAIEILLLNEVSRADGKWLVLAKPARKLPPGQDISIGDLSARILEVRDSGKRVIQFDTGDDLRGIFEKIGEPPLPPYIRRSRDHDLAEDRRRYQTVYAHHSGSIAAPTAGLHFTRYVLRRLQQRGIPVCEIILHVGYGTFQPVRHEDIRKHRMEQEYYEIDAATASCIRATRRKDGS